MFFEQMFERFHEQLPAARTNEDVMYEVSNYEKFVRWFTSFADYVCQSVYVVLLIILVAVLNRGASCTRYLYIPRDFDR